MRQEKFDEKVSRHCEEYKRMLNGAVKKSKLKWRIKFLGPMSLHSSLVSYFCTFDQCFSEALVHLFARIITLVLRCAKPLKMCYW